MKNMHIDIQTGFLVLAKGIAKILTALTAIRRELASIHDALESRDVPRSCGYGNPLDPDTFDVDEFVSRVDEATRELASRGAF